MRFTRLLLTLGLILVTTGAARAQLAFTLTAPAQTGAPGGTLSFLGTLQNTGTGTLFLNGDTFTLAGPGLKLDDSPFLLNAPSSLPDQTPFTGDIFDVQIGPSVAPGIYAGTFSVLGGSNGSAQNTLASQSFRVSVAPAAVPEPGAAALFSAGGVGMLLCRRPRAWRRARHKCI